ncbi:outer membrane beta-barrel protein [Parabacteroides distasonis]|nr:outer membrane beta-barrel protein [Parabacteroides distasonis]
MRTLLILLAVCCNIYMAYAQTITGKVIDESDIPVGYANILLLNSKDSTFVAGCITSEEGEFKLENTAQKGDLLKLSYIGYEDLYLTITEATGYVGILTMKTKATMLGSVTVTGSKPLFKQQNGAMITEVAGSVLSQTHEMSELISQLPGIVKTANGGFQVFGLGTPVIYVNNRKIQSQTELEQLSPKDIKSVELISNPGAKYDAEGKAVLKVVTLKRDEGLNLQLGGKGKQNDHSSYGGDMKLGYKLRGLSLSASYSYDNARNQSLLPQTKEVFLGDNIHRYAQDQTAKDHITNHDWQLSMDYEINDNHNVGIEWNASDNTDKERRNSVLDYFLNEKPVQTTDILNDYKNKTKYNHLNIFYNGQWSKRLSTEFNLDYANNKNKYHQETGETTAGISDMTLSIGNNTLNIYAGKLAFDYKLNEKIGLSWGFEYNHIAGNGILTCNSESTPPSDYKNDENKYAGYAEIAANIGAVMIKGGIRYEDVVSDYANYVDRTGDVHRHYRNLYPSLSVSYNKNGWANNLSFSSRTTRPTFRQLSNSSYYSNEFMYQCGNPLLKPSNSYVIQLNNGYKILNFSASYTYVKDFISADFYVPDNQRNQIVSSYANYDKIQYLKANLTIQKSIAWWKPSISLGITQPFFHSEYLGGKISYNNPQIYVVANQYFQLPKSYLISAYYYFNSGGHQGAVDFKPYQMLNIGVQKSFLDGKLSVSLQAQDIFHTMKFKETERMKNIHFRQTEDYCLWNYSISIIYRLNQIKTKYRGKTSIKQEIDRL